MMIDKREYDMLKMFRPVETSLSFERNGSFRAKCLHERLDTTPTGNNFSNYVALRHNTSQ
jgi:hypothetical protein